MKRVVLIISLFFLFMVNVQANGISIKTNFENSKYSLELYKDDKPISYQEAIEKYGFERYMSFYVDGEEKYFFEGIEITKKEYLEGYSSQTADKTVLEYHEFGYRVHNAKEIMEAIAKIYESNAYGEYHLVFSESEMDSIDFSYIEEEYMKLYGSELNKNMYKYEEYGIVHPIKFSPLINNTEIIINHNYVKTTEEEEKKVNEFLEIFLQEFEGKSDYEKVLGIYTYINNTAKYVEDNGYTNFLDALLSPYDVLIKRESVCIGASTTFQFLAEKLGVNSYIVDHPVLISVEEKSYNTNHTYNVVELNNKWYIIDINNDANLNGFLIGFDETKYDKNDTTYYNIVLEENDYLENNKDVSKEFSFDYEKYDKLINSIKDTIPNVNEPEIKEKSFDFTAYIIIGFSLFVVAGIIYLVKNLKY